MRKPPPPAPINFPPGAAFHCAQHSSILGFDMSAERFLYYNARALASRASVSRAFRLRSQVLHVLQILEHAGIFAAVS